MYFNVFQGLNIKRFHHFIQLTLHEDKSDTMLIHIRSNDLIPSKQCNLNVKVIVQRYIDLALYCRECGVKDINILFILVKRNFHLTRIIRQIYDFLSEYCVSNNFHYLTNDDNSRKNLRKGGIYCNNVDNNVLEKFIS